MNSLGRNIYSLAALAALTACMPRGEHYTAHIQRSWPAGEIRRVEIREIDGAINVHAAATDKVQLDARVRAWGRKPQPNQDNQGYFRTDLEGDTLVIGRRESHHNVHISFFGSEEPHVDYDVIVPPNVELKLNTVNGHIATRGIAGETQAVTVNGWVDLETDGTAEVTAKSVNGRIQATFLKDFQGATFKTVNGRVTTMLPPSASFYGDFTQMNGDFEAAFPLDIHSHPGSRRVSGEVNGGKHELKITTVNGDIKVEQVPVPPVPPVPPALPNVPPQPNAPVPPPPPAPTT
jgi:acylphosphatase